MHTCACQLLDKAKAFHARGARPLAKRALLAIKAFSLGMVVLLSSFPSLAFSHEDPTWATAHDTVVTSERNGIAPGTVFRVRLAGLTGPLEAEYLGTWLSQAGESKTEFIRRVGTYLRGYSAQSGFEACGFVWEDSQAQRFAIPLTTNHGHSHCVNTNLGPGLAMQGFSKSYDTVHVHPEQTHYRVNATDRLLDPVARSKPPHTMVRAPKLMDFSVADYAAGPGYLIVGGRLLYQEGKATGVDLGAVPFPSVPQSTKPGPPVPVQMTADAPDANEAPPVSSPRVSAASAKPKSRRSLT